VHFAIRSGCLWAGALASLLALGGCGKKQAPPTGPGRVLLIGLEGADWDLIRPMATAGDLPHLARLMAARAQGNLRSLQSQATCPTIWTTIATGKSPAEHGVGSAGRSGTALAATDQPRKVLAVWNIASMAGRTVAAVGWPASRPAEEVNGFLVSDFLPYDPAETEAAEGRTSPPGLEAEIAPLVTHPGAAPWSSVLTFLDTPLDTTAMSPPLAELLAPIRWIVAADLSFTRIGEKLYRERQPDFFAVCLRGIGRMEDRFGAYMTPDAVPAGTLRPEGVPYLQGALRAYYRYTDELVGRLLDLADERTTVLVVSDHGFQASASRGLEARRSDGIILLGGRDAGKGEIAGATVYDVTPTALVLLGLPPAGDMGGKVLWSALGPGIHKEKFAATIDTYETGNRAGPGRGATSPVDNELKERLRSLGYTN
jgi:hypothetical protein